MTAIRAARRLDRGEIVVLTVEGRRIEAFHGEMLAAALMAAGVMSMRRSPRDGAPRGAFCLMGACQECVVRVDGAVRQACLVPVADGMRVELRGAL